MSRVKETGGTLSLFLTVVVVFGVVLLGIAYIIGNLRKEKQAITRVEERVELKRFDVGSYEETESSSIGYFFIVYGYSKKTQVRKRKEIIVFSGNKENGYKINYIPIENLTFHLLKKGDTPHLIYKATVKKEVPYWSSGWKSYSKNIDMFINPTEMDKL